MVTARFLLTLAVVVGLMVGPSFDLLRPTPVQVLRPAYWTFERLVPTLHAAILVVAAEEGTYGDDPTCTINGVTSGNFLVLGVYNDNANGEDTTATLTNESPDERIDSQTTPGVAVYTDTASASENKTWTTSNTGTDFMGAHCLEISGLTASPFEAITAAASGNSTTPTSPSVACAAGCIVIGFANIRAAGPIAINTASYTSAENGDNWANVNADTSYKTQTAGSYAVDWTNGGAADWRAVAMSLTENSGGGGGGSGPIPSLSLLGAGR